MLSRRRSRAMKCEELTNFLCSSIEWRCNRVVGAERDPQRVLCAWLATSTVAAVTAPRRRAESGGNRERIGKESGEIQEIPSGRWTVLRSPGGLLAVHGSQAHRVRWPGIAATSEMKQETAYTQKSLVLIILNLVERLK